MNITKAIELLTQMSEPGIVAWDKDDLDAIKLGIEALIRVRDDRGTSYQPVWYPLPGETPEEGRQVNKPQMRRRERTLALWESGYSIKQIAERLLISTRSVYRYIKVKEVRL